MAIVSHPERDLPAGWSSSADAEFNRTAHPGRWMRIAITWHAAIQYLVPIGYQDAGGFHYGAVPGSNSAADLDDLAA